MNNVVAALVILVGVYVLARLANSYDTPEEDYDDDTEAGN